MSADPARRDRLRGQLGRVGVWLTLLGLQSAAAERDAAAEIERLGYPALWFGETAVNKEAFVHAAILLAATRRITVATGIASIYARDPAAAERRPRTRSPRRSMAASCSGSV